MANLSEVNTALHWFTTWARGRDDVHGVLLVGSYARGTEREDSDLDLVVLVESKSPYLEDSRWLEGLGQATSLEREEWGVLSSLRLVLASGLEMEIGLVAASWASISPIDSGTRQVLKGGARILHDPKARLAELLRAMDLDPSI
jgi:predicted nucleotidyltransferase